jgi:hypothetical protein
MSLQTLRARIAHNQTKLIMDGLVEKTLPLRDYHEFLRPGAVSANAIPAQRNIPFQLSCSEPLFVFLSKMENDIRDNRELRIRLHGTDAINIVTQRRPRRDRFGIAVMS